MDKIITLRALLLVHELRRARAKRPAPTRSDHDARSSDARVRSRRACVPPPDALPAPQSHWPLSRATTVVERPATCRCGSVAGFVQLLRFNSRLIVLGGRGTRRAIARRVPPCSSPTGSSSALPCAGVYRSFPLQHATFWKVLHFSFEAEQLLSCPDSLSLVTVSNLSPCRRRRMATAVKCAFPLASGWVLPAAGIDT